MIRPIVRPTVRPTVRPLVRSLVNAAISRHFTTFNSLFNMYGEFSSPVPVNSGDKIQITFRAGSLTAFMPLFDGFNGDRILARVDGDGVTWGFSGITDTKLDGLPITTATNFPTDGLLHTFEATVNGTGYITRVFGNFNDTQGFNGIPANLKIWDNGTLVVDSPIDKAYSPTNNIIENKANPANPITLQNSAADGSSSSKYTFDAGENRWETNNLWTAGVATSNGSEGTFQNVAQETNFPDSGRFAYEVQASGFASGVLQMRIGGATVESISSDGTYSGVTDGTTSECRVRVGATQSNSGASLLPSIKQILELP